MAQDKRLVEMDDDEYRALGDHAEIMFRSQVESVTGAMIYDLLMKNRDQAIKTVTITFEDNGFSECKDKKGVIYKVRRMTVALKEEK